MSSLNKFQFIVQWVLLFLCPMARKYFFIFYTASGPSARLLDHRSPFARYCNDRFDIFRYQVCVEETPEMREKLKDYIISDVRLFSGDFTSRNYELTQEQKGIVEERDFTLTDPSEIRAQEQRISQHEKTIEHEALWWRNIFVLNAEFPTRRCYLEFTNIVNQFHTHVGASVIPFSISYFSDISLLPHQYPLPLMESFGKPNILYSRIRSTFLNRMSPPPPPIDEDDECKLLAMQEDAYWINRYIFAFHRAEYRSDDLPFECNLFWNLMVLRLVWKCDSMNMMCLKRQHTAWRASSISLHILRLFVSLVGAMESPCVMCVYLLYNTPARCSARFEVWRTLSMVWTIREFSM